MKRTEKNASLEKPATRLIAIGSSAGGPQALEVVLRALENHALPIVITQHMPENFTLAFARRMDELVKPIVKEATDGEVLLTGHVYIAPGGKHLILARSASGQLRLTVTDTEPVRRHKPSVDVLFQSVLEVAPDAALGVLLTGMGNDGAQGLLDLFKAGYPTLVQDEATSAVWGMPREAVKLGAAHEKDVLPLTAIARRVRDFAEGKK